MTQKRKIITALDLTKIVSDEQEYIENQFGKKVWENDATLTGKVSIRKDDPSVEAKNMGYYFNLLNCAYDVYYDAGTVIEADDDLVPGYKIPALRDPIPLYGAIIPADCFPAVEKISKMRYAIPVHIQFYEEEDENHPVKGEIILLYGDSLEDVKQVANLCGCDFINWIGWDDHGFVLLSAIEKDADGYRDFA